MKTLFMQNALSGVIKLASAGLTFLMFMYLARAMAPEEYGRFAVMFSIGNFVALVALVGQHTRVLKRLSAAVETGEHAAAGAVFRQAWQVVTRAALALSAALAALAAAAPLVPAVDPAILLGAAFFVLPFAYSELIASVLRAFGALGWALVPRDVAWRGLVAALGAVAAVTGVSLGSAVVVMAAVSIILLALVGLQGIVLMRAVPREIISAGSDRLDRGIFRESGWMWSESLIGVMSISLSVVLTGIVLGAVETGAFFAASKISQVLQLPIIAANVVAAPTIARYHARRDMEGLQAFCRMLALILVLSAVPSAAILFALPEWLLSQFDPEFAFAATPLVLLSIGHLANAFCGTTGVIMLMTGGEKAFVQYIALSETAGLVLILVLTPLYGLTGAASAALVGKLGWNLCALIWCRRTLGIDPSMLSLLRW